ncbi:Lrp/AsnC family transcriptional regulator [Nonomuraea diastatica]|uniref:Lrp/AsnC family transcriptional regulator n=1 Tax=Nonomuraea diastatica TaxID=1848329 RepID=A0A4V2YEG3_9ACTN|nr:Lrp/AsnC family transcriptional regulator [Nonomuraea diastatica]TDD19186.1 Lrp/AsnC family transcriptional regulator [Nonomuraea diastatica]
MDATDLLDPVDIAILRELQSDGRLPNKTLAQRVGIAPSTCLDRTARLQRLGVITGFLARIDPASIGRNVQALLAIQFQAHSRALVGPFVEFVRGLPETRALHHLTGGDDYLVHVSCADTADLQRLVLEFTARVEVGRVQTQLIFESWEGGPQVPASPVVRRRASR